MLHARRCGKGDSRLVLIAAKAFVGDIMIAPRTFIADRSAIDGAKLRLPAGLGVRRIFAAQFDDKDQSHFTIKYEIDDQPGTIDGWLQVDDSVKLQIRDGPAGLTVRP